MKQKLHVIVLVLMVSVMMWGAVTPAAAIEVIGDLPEFSFKCGALIVSDDLVVKANRDTWGGPAAEVFVMGLYYGNNKFIELQRMVIPLGETYTLLKQNTVLPFSVTYPVVLRIYSPGNNSSDEIILEKIYDEIPCNGEEVVVKAPHLNEGNCDDSRVYLYPGFDDNGKNALFVYRGVSATSGAFTFRIDGDDVNALMENPPAENTLVKSAAGYEFYVLNTGQLQLNTPYDAEGKSCVLIIDSLAPTYFHSYYNKR